MRAVRQQHRRRGLAVVFALIVLSIVGLMMTFIAKQAAAVRRLQDGRLARLQATWLARAGAETALARLVQQPGEFSEELTDVMPGGRVTIRVTAEPGKPDTFRIRSEAIIAEPAAAVVAMARVVRRDSTGGITTLIVIETP